MENKKLILIIDDEKDFAEMMRFSLENSNFNVAIASSPEEGLLKAKQKPDLILLDLNMPGMNGHEVCKLIKEDTSTMHIPVIMLTCQDNTMDKVQAFNLGVADYIGKQFPTEEILVRVKSLLRRFSNTLTFANEQEKNEKIMQLRNIIETKDIRTVFQPIVTLASRQPIGYEALARGPRGTFFENPLNLFALAAEANMSYELDSLCLDLAAQRANSFLKQQLLFLNVDASVINSAYLKSLQFLKGSIIAPSQICIEITERTFISNFDKIAENLNSLKPMGVMIVIDDLGEGYSSLRAIVELKPAFIKADISLVRDVNSDVIKQSLIQVISKLAKKVNSLLIAEGVETEEEYKTLLSMRVEFGQGYLFARPTEIV
jgi:EAL domain-containing protein (putative c-di-GMP-specific phosphodiesterase class I)